jgi:hypothetical protein
MLCTCSRPAAFGANIRGFNTYGRYVRSIGTAVDASDGRLRRPTDWPSGHRQAWSYALLLLVS